MHEVSIAHSLLRTTEAAAREAGLRRVTRMNVELGARAGLSPHALAFALDLARAGSLAADAEIVYSGPGAEAGDEYGGHGHDDKPHDHDALDTDVRLAWIEGT